jgi:hypothetical protein
MRSDHSQAIVERQSGREYLSFGDKSRTESHEDDVINAQTGDWLRQSLVASRPVLIDAKIFANIWVFMTSIYYYSHLFIAKVEPFLSNEKALQN